MSIAVKIILCFYIAWELYVIFSRKHPQVWVKESVSDFVMNPGGHHNSGAHTSHFKEEYNPWEHGFDIAVGLFDT